MQIIEPAGRAAVALARDRCLRVVDIEGSQVADLVAFAAGDPAEWISNGRSFDHERTIAFTTGSRLYSNKSRPMLTIHDDTVGRHDFLYAACSVEMFWRQYGVTGHHANCLDNLREALAAMDVFPGHIPTPFNVFMNVQVGTGGSLAIHAPQSAAGDEVLFRAEMDLVVALSACPAMECNGGNASAIGYEVV